LAEYTIFVQFLCTPTTYIVGEIEEMSVGGFSQHTIHYSYRVAVC